MAKSKAALRKQVAALPVRRVGEAGEDVRILLMTSRETRRFIIPKGWPMKGRKDYRAAAIEAMQEMGLVGRVHRKPIGSYIYWKRLSERFVLCRVKVYLLEVETQLPLWREKGQRRAAWLTIGQAADLVDDAGLIDLIRAVPKALSRRKPAVAKPLKLKKRAAAKAVPASQSAEDV